jgi:hypothetical protein
MSERRDDVRPGSADDVAARIDPVMTFLRGGLDALKQPSAS